MEHEEIEKKRRQLIQVANKHGLTSHITLQCSRELDRLLDLYQKKLLSKKEPHKVQI